MMPDFTKCNTHYVLWSPEGERWYAAVRQADGSYSILDRTWRNVGDAIFIINGGFDHSQLTGSQDAPFTVTIY
jgi:hypothetical protein